MPSTFVARGEREHAVVIVGGGPTGLMLAAELALAGVDVAILERRPDQALAGSRAGGLHPRTLELFDQRGIVERFVRLGQKHGAASFHLVPLALDDLPTRHDYVLAIWQNEIERVLAEWVAELGVTVHRGREVVAFEQHEHGVRVEASDGAAFRGRYVVACDGGRSLVRRCAGIEFRGWDATTSWLIAEAATTSEPAWGLRHDASGTHAIGPLAGGARARVVLTEPELVTGREPTLQDVRDSLLAVYGTDYGIHDATWISRFTDATRQAATYRERRVLLAGDAAHVHPPLGGQGLNLGVQDAVNLGWKLAQVLAGVSPPSLLDTYEAERHPVAARVLRTTMAQVALRRTDERTRALGELVSEFARMDEPRRRLATELAGLDVCYGAADGHPVQGRRMPDIDVLTSSGPRTVYSLLHAARAVLLDFSADGCTRASPWADRVRHVAASCAGTWVLPTIGEVAAPRAVLVRPDGHVAWAGDPAEPGLLTALHYWFGEAGAASA